MGSIRRKLIGVRVMLITSIAVPVTGAIIIMSSTTIDAAVGTGLLIRLIIGGVALHIFARAMARKWNKEYQESMMSEIVAAMHKGN